MKLKNLVVGFFIIIGLVPSITSPVQSPKKATVYKALKVAWYSTELIAALFSYGALQVLGWKEKTYFEEEDIPTLERIIFNIQNLDPLRTLTCSLFQVPFLASMGHALYGLKHELLSKNKITDK